MAETHYENFSIASLFIPKSKRQDLYNIYAFCRIADDFADEAADHNASKSLDLWESWLNAASDGSPDVPDLFKALGSTIRDNQLTLEPFQNLLNAFRLDLTRMRYKDWDDLRAYTRLSADPVGRIVLELFGYCDEKLSVHSDEICTALQLANHWQDVWEDWGRGRCYIPQTDMERFNVSEDDIANRTGGANFRRLMTFEVGRARELFDSGKELVNQVGKPLSSQLLLYYYGGTAALDAIEKVNYDVLNHPAKVKRRAKINIALKVLLHRLKS